MLVGLLVIAIGALLGGLAASVGRGREEDRPVELEPVVRPAAWARLTAPGPAEEPEPTPTTSPSRSQRQPRPVRIAIPAIGVRAPVRRLGLNPDRTLQVPSNFADTGWWGGGPRPGEPGAAVVVGHVDSKTGPAVFYRIRELRRGDRITIVRADESVVRFSVRSLANYPKDDFPTAKVYGTAKRPLLRLITCSGQFDSSSGHYLDNTVVYAVPVAPR